MSSAQEDAILNPFTYALFGAVKLIVFVLLTWVVTILIEVILVYAVYPQENIMHSRSMLTYELTNLNNPITGQANGITTLAKKSIMSIEQHVLIDALRVSNTERFEKGHYAREARTLKERFETFNGSVIDVMFSVVEIAVNMTQLTIARLAVVLNAYLLIVVVVLWAFTEGVCRHLKYRAAGRHITGTVYTYSKWLTRSFLFVPGVVYLGAPISLPVWLVFTVMAVLIGYGIIIWVSNYKMNL